MTNQVKTKIYRLKEDDPAVSFDVNLGKELENIDFDYQSYRKMRTDMSENLEVQKGIKPKADQPGSIHFKARKGFFKNKGSFNPTNNSIEVSVAKKGKIESVVNETLIHETQHSVDVTNLAEIDPKNFGERSAVVGNVAMIGAFGAIPIQYGSLASELLTGYGETGAKVGVIVGLGALAINRKEYYFSEREKRARQAEKYYKDKYDSIVKIKSK